MKLFGIPLHIQPFFLVILALLGMHHLPDIPAFLAWCVIATGSILLHELGHALVGRRFGLEPIIVLHGMGGLTSWKIPKPITPGRDILISLAGPGAGFVLGALVLALAFATGTLGQEGLLGGAIGDLLWVNFGWGLLNLIPMLPLDGGRVMYALLRLITPRHAAIVGRVISIVIALALIGLSIWAELWVTALIVAWIAWSNLRVPAQTAAPDEPPLDADTEQALQAATEALKRRELQPAVAHFERARQTAPPHIRDNLAEVLATLAFKAGDVERAEDMLRQLPADRPPHPELLGRVALARGRPADAILPLAQALNAEPSLDRATLLATAYLDNRQAQAAWTLLEQLKERLSERDLLALEQLIAFHTQAFERSLDVGRALFQRFGDPLAAFNAACAAARLDREADALRFLEDALRAGLDEPGRILAEPDLAAVRKRPEFEAWAATHLQTRSVDAP